MSSVGDWRQQQYGFSWDTDEFRLVVDSRHQVWKVANFDVGDVRQVVMPWWEWA